MHEANVATFIKVIVEETTPKCKEHRCSEQRIRPSLVHWSDALNFKFFRKLRETALEGRAFELCHDGLDIKHGRKVQKQQVEELDFLVWQRRTGQHLKQVGDVEATVKSHPLHLLHEHQARRHELLTKILHINAHFFMQIKVNATAHKQVNGVLRIHIICEAKFKVKLPAWAVLREITLIIRKCNTELDQFKQVYVATKSLILKVIRAFK
mmetsp:Transcript_3648/g.6496  ORF Transcript_3648/g.6496 Transcript_3648/m.6496 type:complete len:210 (-) Transcript_3648:822-1451(-)